MNDSDLKNRFAKVIQVTKKVLDALILSIFLSLPLILVLGAISGIFELDGPMRIGGRQTAGLGSDFGLVLRMVFAFALVGGVLLLLRHGITIWHWLKSRPMIGGLVGLVFSLLLVAWLVSAFQKTPAEQLAIAIGEADLGQVEKVLRRNEFEIRTLDLQLGRSIEEGKLDIAAALIAEGADVNRAREFDDRSLLSTAILLGEKEGILFLIEQGAELNQTAELGRTPLIELVDFLIPNENLSKADRVAIAKAMLAAGADPFIVDDFGKTAGDHAKSREFPELLAVLPPSP